MNVLIRGFSKVLEKRVRALIQKEATLRDCDKLPETGPCKGHTSLDTTTTDSLTRVIFLFMEDAVETRTTSRLRKNVTRNVEYNAKKMRTTKIAGRRVH
ncbi:hypothetical protein HNY73_021443 [Argiope bruennichi]|uniref:Uncharacterized protein n=1 Tax=Argiope bruennichi TaxID=94029 RepID=A0A8T0DZY2_ARGBR|nr:hypothetical protein HNY73_021443 [Argiope bruennichi]